MALEQLVGAVAGQEWLDPVAGSLQDAIGGLYEAAGGFGLATRNFLHGIWLEHPLHPLLTDVPVGAWTLAALFDALEVTAGRDDLGAAADLLIGTGVMGALAAAAAGFTDWQVLKTPRLQRIGVSHALLNVSAVGLYAASLLSRRSGQRALGRWLATLGLGIMTASAYLGSDLIYAHGVGVDHTAGQQLPGGYTRAMADSELQEGHPQRALVGEVPVLLVRYQGQVFGLDDTCAHMGCSLAEGRLEGDSIRCRCHGSRYALASGQVLEGPSAFPQPVFDTRVRGGQIEVRARPKPG